MKNVIANLLFVVLIISISNSCDFLDEKKDNQSKVDEANCSIEGYLKKKNDLRLKVGLYPITSDYSVKWNSDSTMIRHKNDLIPEDFFQAFHKSKNTLNVLMERYLKLTHT